MAFTPIPHITFFLPQWAQNSLYAILGLLFLAVLTYVLLNKKLSNWEKLLLLVLCFLVPLVGCLIAIYYARTFEPVNLFSTKKVRRPKTGRLRL